MSQTKLLANLVRAQETAVYDAWRSRKPLSYATLANVYIASLKALASHPVMIDKNSSAEEKKTLIAVTKWSMNTIATNALLRRKVRELPQISSELGAIEPRTLDPGVVFPLDEMLKIAQQRHPSYLSFDDLKRHGGQDGDLSSAIDSLKDDRANAGRKKNQQEEEEEKEMMVKLPQEFSKVLVLSPESLALARPFVQVQDLRLKTQSFNAFQIDQKVLKRLRQCMHKGVLSRSAGGDMQHEEQGSDRPAVLVVPFSVLHTIHTAWVEGLDRYRSQEKKSGDEDEVYDDDDDEEQVVPSTSRREILEEGMAEADGKITVSAAQMAMNAYVENDREQRRRTRKVLENLKELRGIEHEAEAKKFSKPVSIDYPEFKMITFTDEVDMLLRHDAAAGVASGSVMLAGCKSWEIRLALLTKRIGTLVASAPKPIPVVMQTHEINAMKREKLRDVCATVGTPVETITTKLDAVGGVVKPRDRDANKGDMLKRAAERMQRNAQGSKRAKQFHAKAQKKDVATAGYDMQ